MTDTSSDDLDRALALAAGAFPEVAASGQRQRAGWLRAVAAELTAHADELVGLAVDESHLTEARLRGEVQRTSIQLELFADVLEDGNYVEAIIDQSDPDFVIGPKPDLRRMLVPVGPAAVYAASNFPFAFSVAGGDTASALAAGCSVIVKGHPGHPVTAERTAELVSAALTRAGAPGGAFALVQGMDVGVELVKDERIKAAGFTGSVAGGRALFDLATSRPTPIKFFGELGSINPAIVTSRAADERSAEIAAGFVASYTLGVGQFCTKPGLLFVPSGHAILDQIVEQVGAAVSGTLLNDKIAKGYSARLDELRATGGVRVLVDGAGADGLTAAPSLLTVDSADFLTSAEELLTECFGPASVVVQYTDTDQLLAAVQVLQGSLTTTIHGTDADSNDVGALVALLTERSGRVIWNGWPTGVAVTWAMTHGGPYPASTLDHTSVGATAIHRWLRPVSYQSVPAALLPAALRDENPLGLTRRINGKLTAAPIG